jgi:ubiquinone/menaquinone biosynthesis C-methylase UbiE
MESNLLSWDQLADWFDQKQGDEGDLWHRELINPTLLQVLGDPAGMRVLDLACGNGALARRMARMGAQVVGADLSALLVTRAQEREAGDSLGITYHTTNATDLAAFQDGSFDVVVCNMGAMDMPDATTQRAFQEVARVLTGSGRFIACIPHPCFEGDETSAWVVEKVGRVTTVFRKVSRYRELYEIPNHWALAPGQYAFTVSYHRPLSWYFRAMRNAGLAVVALEENEPTQEFIREDTEGDWIKEIPLHCVFEAVKLS